jgi:hypothetical protein
MTMKNEFDMAPRRLGILCCALLMASMALGCGPAEDELAESENVAESSQPILYNDISIFRNNRYKVADTFISR